MLDIKFTDCLQEQGLVIELEQNEGDKKESTSSQKRFCTIQTLKETVTDLKYNKVFNVSTKSGGDRRSFLSLWCCRSSLSKKGTQPFKY